MRKLSHGTPSRYENNTDICQILIRRRLSMAVHSLRGRLLLIFMRCFHRSGDRRFFNVVGFLTQRFLLVAYNSNVP